MTPNLSVELSRLYPYSPASATGKNLVALPYRILVLMKLVKLAAILLLPVLLGGCVYACTTGPAPELRGIAGWVNTSGTTIEEQRGRVVLLDFWTYSCVNCIRTFPYLSAWHDKYHRYGLTTIGIHSPEFEFEKSLSNVEEAARTHRLEYPIALDNLFATWDAYGNNAWPSKFLIDQEGMVRYARRGEGAYVETEEAIRELLEETGVDLSHIPADTTPDPEFVDEAFAADPAQRITRELYAGYLRNHTLPSSAFATLVGETPSYIMHPEYYTVEDGEVLYHDFQRYFNHFIYINGLWYNGPESISHAREASGFEDYVAIKFYATSVNSVMAATPPEDTPDAASARYRSGSHRVRVLLDGKPLSRSQAGKDVEFDNAGNSYVTVGEPDLYRLVELPEFSSHELQLAVNTPGLSLFTFTFGAYPEGP